MPAMYHVVCFQSLTIAFLYYVMHARYCFAEEAPFRMKFSKEIEVFNPPLASAASSEPWVHSVFAFTHSWPRKTLFKRDSAVTHRLVSNMFSSFKDVSEIVKKPVLDHLCRKCHRLLFLLQKTPVLSLSLNVVVIREQIHFSLQRAASSIQYTVFRWIGCVNLSIRQPCLLVLKQCMGFYFNWIDSLAPVMKTLLPIIVPNV